MSENLFPMFLRACERVGRTEVANQCGLHLGTIKRWIELKSVPPQYWFDLARILDINVDYESFTAKEKDQFFTEPSAAVDCLSSLYALLRDNNIDPNEYTFIEPSAGDGSFFNCLPPDRRIGLDIEPRADGVIAQDFLTWTPPPGKYICVGNPPFGLRGHTALKFINHASTFCDFVAFIVPQLFNSNGKGSCKGRVLGLNLIHTDTTDTTFHNPDGTNVKVNVVFQVWSKNIESPEVINNLDGIIKLVSLSDGGTPSSTRNKALHHKCDYYLPSTVFGSSSMRLYNTFDELPLRRGYGIIVLTNEETIGAIIRATDWTNVAFVSTNNAYNLRFDLITNHIADCLH